MEYATRQKIQKKRPLTEAEKTAIRNCDFTLKERAFVEILYGTGVRRGEEIALTVNDVNFITEEIYVNKSVAFIDNNQPEVKIPKTDFSNRGIPMPNSLIQTLKEYIGTIPFIYLRVRMGKL